MSRVLGIDPSLTATGCALIDLDQAAVVDTWTRTSKGHAGDTLAQRLERIDAITIDVATTADLALVVIEGPSLGQQRQTGTFDRAGLWWAIVTCLDMRGIPVIEVPPATRARYATGKGNAGKDTVLLEVARRYPTVPVANNNEADALVLAAMGLHALTGEPLAPLPQTHTAALDAVTWPTRRAA